MDGPTDIDSIMSQTTPNNMTVYVGNVSAETTEQILRTHFA